MNIYINKIKLLEQLKQELQTLVATPHDHIEEEIRAYKFMIDKIENTECIDAEPVRHGYWKKETLLGCEPYYLCSECGKLHDQDYMRCNDCGAIMDGGK